MRAEFWTGRALSVDDQNVEAARLMAEINEAQDRPMALNWRIKVAQCEPGSSDDMMLWAKTAYRFGQREMAARVLKSLPPDFQNRSADYHELMAGCALDHRDFHGTEEHFARAVELDRDNPIHRVNLAAFRLVNASSQEVQVAAARDLDAAMADPAARLPAARALLANAIRNRDSKSAQPIAKKLQAIPEHTFTDDLSCLELEPTEASFKSTLADLEKRVAEDGSKAIAIGDWLNSHQMAPETLRWFAELPTPVRANIRVQIIAAEAYLATGDWPGLEAFLRKCRWESGEFLRRAMLIRGRRELAQPWEKDWNQLVTDVESNPPDGFLLAQVVTGWKWRAETLKLLWDASTKPKTNSLALQNLWDLYTQTNETREMLRVARAQVELDSTNPSRKNNEAFLSLLVYGASGRAERLAREAAKANPEIPEWTATYAYALHLAGKNAAARQVIAALPPEALHRPGIALYYAIVLAANGDQAQARDALARLDSRGMLPEERKLAADLAQQLSVARR